MKKNRKLLGGFVALLHICLIAFPLLVLGYNVAYRTIQSNQSYTQRVSPSNSGNFKVVYYQSNELTQTSDMVVGNYYQLNVQFVCETTYSSDNALLILEDQGTNIFSFLQYKQTYLSNSSVKINEFVSGQIDYLEVFMTQSSNSREGNFYNGDDVTDNNTLSLTYETFSSFVMRYSILFEYLYDDDINFDNLINRYSPNNTGYIEITQVDNNIFYEMEEIIDDSTSTEVTYSFEDNSFLGLRDTLNYFNVVTSDIPLNDMEWSYVYEEYYLGFPVLMDVDYLNVFDTGTTNNDSLNSVLAFLNFYFNWIINMSIVVFVPEMLIVFIDICRKLIYSFSHKIEGGY